MRQTKTFLKSMLNALPLPVLVVDRDLKVVEFNEAAVPLVELTKGRGFRRLRGNPARNGREGCRCGPGRIVSGRG